MRLKNDEKAFDSSAFHTLDIIIFATIPSVYKCYALLRYLAIEIARSASRESAAFWKVTYPRKAGPFRIETWEQPPTSLIRHWFRSSRSKAKGFPRKRERERARLWVITRRWIVKKGSRFHPSSNYRGASRKFPTWSFVFFFLRRSSFSFFNSFEFFLIHTILSTLKRSRIICFNYAEYLKVLIINSFL